MQKLDLHTPNFTDENIEKLATMFPHCVTENRDEQGKLKKAIDFDLLKQELSANIVDGQRERYHINWPGKRQALITANTPINKTLRPCREESVDFDSTQNLYIEGDNLDALKLLQETYLGKVKMIYIDPPYNTGKDFVYKDNFTADKAEYALDSEQRDEEGGRLVANPETNGRYHSDWLSMMYPRLKLARNLLKDDGVIFISIDDNEVDNLRKICDEIFGEDNFIANFIWEKRTNRENRKAVSSRHDYVICYCKTKDIDSRVVKQLPMSKKALANYKNPDSDSRGLWKSDPAHAQAGHGTKEQFYVLTSPSGKKHELESGRCWVYTKLVMNEAIKGGRIWFGREGNGVPRIKTYLDAKKRGLTPETIWFADDVATNEQAKNALKQLFDGVAVFDTPKPIDLIKRSLLLTSEEGLTLDFFSGTCVTAHAVMQLNAEDGGKRKFIMVQLPEKTDEKSEAHKAGYATIAEIGKERIRRAGKKIKQDNTDKTGIENLDVGFRVLKVDSSNMNDVYYSPDELSQVSLLSAADNIKADRTAEDLLFQVLLDWGVDLSLPIVKEEIEGKAVYFVGDNTHADYELAACFDDGVDETLVKTLAKRKIKRVVFKDTGFAKDDIKGNVEQIFKQLSPATDVRVI